MFEELNELLDKWIINKLEDMKEGRAGFMSRLTADNGELLAIYDKTIAFLETEAAKRGLSSNYLYTA